MTNCDATKYVVHTGPLNLAFTIQSHQSGPYLVSLLMVGVMAAVVWAVAFFCASSFSSWLMSGEEYERLSFDCSRSRLASGSAG